MRQETSQRVLMDGNRAAAEGIRIAAPQVIAVYPITPQTPVTTHLSRFIKEGKLACRYVQVESEHSALSVCDGATAAGVRSFTATSSQGLVYMYEMIYMVAGQRLPIVMYLVNRSLAMPTTLMSEHNDALSTRDSGWIQLHCETAQEVLDLSLIAYKVAEDPRVLLPVMFCADGFQLSHTEETVTLPDEKSAQEFLPPYTPAHIHLDQEDPMFVGVAPREMNLTEYRFNMTAAMDAAKTAIDEAGREFGDRFGRKYGLIDRYLTEDAEMIYVVVGSMAGTIRAAIDRLREQGKRAGMIKLWSVRPFPTEQLAAAVGGCNAVAVIERSTSIGSSHNAGCLFPEVASVFYRRESQPYIQPFIAGLAARRVDVDDLIAAYDVTMQRAEENHSVSGAEWINLCSTPQPEKP